MRQQATAYYIISFLNSMSNGLIGPFFIIYLLSLNLSIAQTGLILMLERIATVIFELPTGAFADTYGNKKSVLVSFALMAMVACGWFLATAWPLAAILAVLSGVAYTFQSGAKDSLMIESLDLSDDAQNRKNIFSLVSIYSNGGFIVGSGLGIILSLTLLKSLWLGVAGLNILLLIMGSLLLFEPKTETSVKRNFKIHLKVLTNTIKDALSYIRNKRQLVIPLIIIAIMSAVMSGYNLVYTFHFKEILNAPNYFFGILGILSSLVGMIGVYLSKRLAGKKSSIIVLILYATILILTFILFGLTTTILAAMVLFMLIESSLHAWYPIFQSWFNSFLPNATRSSILSLGSMVSLVAAAVAEGVTGYSLARLPEIFVLIGGIIFLFVIIGLLFKQRAVYGDKEN